MRLALFSAIIGLCATIAVAQNDSVITPQAQRVIQFMRERKHAYERGDASAWGRHVSEKCRSSKQAAESPARLNSWQE
jgi:hypothetical protein